MTTRPEPTANGSRDAFTKTALSVLLLLAGLFLIVYTLLVPLKGQTTGTVVEITGVERILKNELLYQYTVQLTVDGQTLSAGEIGSTTRYDLEEEVPLLVDPQTGSVGFDTVASPVALILGGGILMLLGAGVLTFHFTRKSQINDNLFQPGTDSPNGLPVPPALSGKATSSRLSLSQFRPPSRLTIALIAISTIGVAAAANEIRFRSFGASEVLEIEQAEILGARSGVVVSVETGGVMMDATIPFLDYLENPNKVEVYPATDPLEARSSRNRMDGRATGLSMVAGLILGLAAATATKKAGIGTKATQAKS